MVDMTALSIEHFSAVDYIQELRHANFTEQQAEAVVKIAEKQAQSLQDQYSELNKQRTELDNMKAKELVTKGDLQKEIAMLRYDTLKFIVWTAVIASATIITAITGTMYSMLKLMLH